MAVVDLAASVNIVAVAVVAVAAANAVVYVYLTAAVNIVIFDAVGVLGMLTLSMLM